MLVKYPGLTLVGGLAIAFAIAVGAGTFEFLTQLVHPTLPLDDGDRIVGIRLWDTPSGSAKASARTTSPGGATSSTSVEDLGAFRTLERNLTTESGLPEPVQVAEISASAFRVARVPPLKGRFLVAADEQAGRARGRRDRIRRVADALRRRSCRGRADRAAGKRAEHRRRCHAGALCVPGLSQYLGSAPARCPRAASGTRDSGVRPAGSGRHA